MGQLIGLQGFGTHNVIRIADFTSRTSEVMASFPDVNLTGLEVIDGRWIIAGLWGSKNQLTIVDAQGQHSPSSVDQLEGIPGPPYGLFYDDESRQLIVAYIGSIHDRAHPGAVVIYDVAK